MTRILVCKQNIRKKYKQEVGDADGKRERFGWFLGPPTATIDWCETNYEVTHYIAEFWNTVSNLAIIVPPLVGFYCALKDKMERGYLYHYLALLAVGIGSWCFHATLLYKYQLLDELPMIYGSAFMISALASVDSKPDTSLRKLHIFLFLYCLLVTVIYLVIEDPIFHEVAYGLMAVTITGLSIRTVRKYESRGILLVIGTGIYVVGFIIWNLDNIFCSRIKELRQDVGYPLKPLLQGHAWWHIGAGFGTYVGLVFTHHARARFLQKQTRFETIGLIPCVRVEDSPLVQKTD